MEGYKKVDISEGIKNMMQNFTKYDISPAMMLNIDLYKDIKTPDLPDIEPIPLADHIERTQKYQEKSLEMLQSINENTANLSMLVELINQSNDKQDELIEIMAEILAIAKAKNEEEAESKLKK